MPQEDSLGLAADNAYIPVSLGKLTNIDPDSHALINKKVLQDKRLTFCICHSSLQSFELNGLHIDILMGRRLNLELHDLRRK